MAEGVIGMTVTIDPLPQTLTANEKRVKELLDRGKTVFQIAYKLHMSFEAVRDIIFEIRKKECLMAGKPRLTQEERAEIYRLYREEGMTQRDLAARYGVTHATIGNIVKKMESVQQMCDALTAADKPMKNTGINPEFDQAVDAMIAESSVEVTAAPLAEGVQDQPAELEPVIVAKLPHVIWSALDDKCCEINIDIETREAQIAELKAEIRALEAQKQDIQKWMEAHE